MRNFFERMKKNVVCMWGVSYIVILLIPIVTIFINYHYNVRVIRKEIISGNQMVLDNLGDRVDEYLNENMTLYSDISKNEAFKEWIINQEKDSYFYKDTYNLMKQVEINFSSNSKYSCFLYFVDLDYALYPIGGADKDSYYQTLKFNHSDGPDFEGWYRTMTKKYSKEYFVLDFWHHNTTSPCITFANTIAYWQNEVNIFVGFPVSEIEALVKDMEQGVKMLITIEDEPFLLIVDGGMVPITPSISLEEILEENDYTSIQKQSENQGITYYLIIPKDIFWREAQHTRDVLTISIVSMLVMGAVSIILLLRYNYRPIYRLLIKIGGSERGGNEFAQLEDVYIKLKEQNIFMNKKLGDLKESAQNNRLLAMMKGREVKEDDEAIFCLEDTQASILVGFKLPFADGGHDELLFFVIDNIFSELMDNENFLKVEDGQYVFYLFLIEEKNGIHWRMDCIEKLNFLSELLKEKGHVDLLAAISAKERSVDKISNQYSDIMEAFEYAQIVGESGVIDAEILKASDMKTMHFKVGAMMGDALIKRDNVKVMEHAEKFFAVSDQVSFLVFRMQILEIFLVITKVFYDMEIAEESRTYLQSYLEPLVGIRDRKEAKLLLGDVLEYACSVICAQEQSREKKIVTYVKEYVETHYVEDALSISMIADSIGLSPKHVGRVFKCETGEGIPDYINRVRVAKAQILLRNGTYSVEEVGRKVGYASGKTFRRAFVKLQGVTPGKYEDEAE